MNHAFTIKIKEILAAEFGSQADEIYEKSYLLQYLNIKTRSANRGAKARGSFANLYAVYVLIEDYLKQNFDQRNDYADYQGARYTDLLHRQRELPFGRKLQNHALNSRMNVEFKGYFPQAEYIPILRDSQTNRYWINEHLLKIRLQADSYNIAFASLQIIEEYMEAKLGAFNTFIQTCERLKSVAQENDIAVQEFIAGLLAPNTDARIFEIASYAILKFYYHEQTIYFGYDLEHLQEENLKLYKTGRTNANDGGIDFVMRPLGRFFQVTETVDVKKYFLDIDKIEHYPISFVIKSTESIIELQRRLREGAEKQFSINTIINKYMNCIEEIINLEELKRRFIAASTNGYLRSILDEIIIQSKVEFNYNEAGDE
jgi:hypothetical protein